MPEFSIPEMQNPDGGWPYQGASSWTEPTVYALLVDLANGGPADVRRRGLDWLRRRQRPDGGWAPHRQVDQSTWVTALVTLLPAEWIGAAAHARGLAWLLRQTGEESARLFRLREWLLGHAAAPAAEEGWPWYPGEAAWVIPTSLAVLALEKSCRLRPLEGAPARIAKARRFLLQHRCDDGGWNHGSARALGYAGDSYPETTGLALLAFPPGAVPPATLERARRHLHQGRSSEGSSWLRMALAAHRQELPEMAQPPCRGLRDACLALLADAAARGRNVFLEHAWLAS